MAMYGQSIGGVDLNRINTYNYISSYFDNPLMARFKVTKTHVMYGCRIKSLLARDKKYIIAIVPVSDSTEDETISLDDLPWSCLQMRTVDDVYKVPLHTYKPKTDQIASSTINVFKKSDSMYSYECKGLPNTYLFLLYNKTQTRTYADAGILGMGIETFNTLISFDRG